MKKTVLLFILSSLTSVFAIASIAQIKMTNQKQNQIVVPDPRAVVDTYFMWGNLESDTFFLPKSELITCKDAGAFYELLKVIEFKKFYDFSPNDVFAYAAQYDCNESSDQVVLTSEIGLFSLSLTGNKILAEYTQSLNGKKWFTNTLAFQKPRYQMIRHVVAAAEGEGKNYKWTEASYYEELEVGNYMRSGYEASVRFKNLMESQSRVNSINLFLEEKVKSSSIKNELLKAAKTAKYIYYFYTTLNEYQKYPYNSRTAIDFYGDGNQLFAVSYLCNPNCQEIESLKKPALISKPK